MNKFLLTLVAFKCRAFAGLAINSILKNTNPANFHLIIIDNGSNDATTELFKTYKDNPNITVIINPENIGFPAAVNQGIDYFYNHPEFDYFTTVHSDTVCMSSNWNEKLVNTFQQNPNIHCLGGMATNQDEGQPVYGDVYQKMISYKHGTANLKGISDIKQLEEALNSLYGDPNKRVAEIETKFKDQLFKQSDNSFLTFKRKLVEEVGYFDEAFFPGMGEDSDYYNRMNLLGYEIWRTGNVYTHHWCSVTYFGTMDGRQVHDRALGRLASKKTYDQECLKYSCIHNSDGNCNKKCAVPPATVCTNYSLNPQYNKVNETFFPVR